MLNKKPVAVCTKCGKYTDNATLINQNCPIKYEKTGKCKGIHRSMLSDKDWKKCSNCFGIRIINKDKCNICQGTGYVCIRKSY